METRYRYSNHRSPSLIGFNGATVFQPWRHRKVVRSHVSTIRVFQWSHGFSTMETYKPVVHSPRLSSVSMEPRFFNHGDVQVKGRVCLSG